MKTTLTLAMCAALSVAAAACGDDDDAASGDSAELTAPATDAADVDPDLGPDVAADCAAFLAFGEALPDDEPAVGEEITDEYREQLEAARSELEDLDLQTDLADDARDALGDLLDEVIDADTFPEPEEETPASLQTFGEQCAAAAPSSGG